MLSLRRVSIVLAIVAGLTWSAASLAVSRAKLSTGSDPDAVSSTIHTPGTSVSTSPLLAARYHLRKRTSQFFQRSTGSKSSDAGKTKRCRRSDVQQDQSSDKPEGNDVAARYHLRGRTARFFGRVVG